MTTDPKPVTEDDLVVLEAEYPGSCWDELLIRRVCAALRDARADLETLSDAIDAEVRERQRAQAELAEIRIAWEAVQEAPGPLTIGRMNEVIGD